MKKHDVDTGMAYLLFCAALLIVLLIFIYNTMPDY
jgi:hypothetical protein